MAAPRGARGAESVGLTTCWVSGECTRNQHGIDVNCNCEVNKDFQNRTVARPIINNSESGPFSPPPAEHGEGRPKAGRAAGTALLQEGTAVAPHALLEISVHLQSCGNWFRARETEPGAASAPDAALKAGNGRLPESACLPSRTLRFWKTGGGMFIHSCPHSGSPGGHEGTEITC